MDAATTAAASAAAAARLVLSPVGALVLPLHGAARLSILNAARAPRRLTATLAGGAALEYCLYLDGGTGAEVSVVSGVVAPGLSLSLAVAAAVTALWRQRAE